MILNLQSPRSRTLRAAVLACISLTLAGCGAGIVPGSKSTTTPVQPTATPIISLSPTSITFAKTVFGATSAAATVTVSNTGNATLVFNSITLADTINFGMTNACQTSLAAGASCALSLTLKPAAIVNGTASDASYTSTVTFTDNSNNVANAQQTIALAGTGTADTVLAPQVALTPTWRSCTKSCQVQCEHGEWNTGSDLQCIFLRLWVR